MLLLLLRVTPWHGGTSRGKGTCPGLASPVSHSAEPGVSPLPQGQRAPSWSHDQQELLSNPGIKGLFVRSSPTLFLLVFFYSPRSLFPTQDFPTTPGHSSGQGVGWSLLNQDLPSSEKAFFLSVF